jgi:hypothetical protein
MKQAILLFVGLITFISLPAQKVAEGIKQLISKNEIEAHLTFLAADEMRGRDTGSPELAIAGNYIAAYFKRCGLRELSGAPSYFQPVALEKVTPPTRGTVKVGNKELLLKDDFVVLAGGDVAWNGDFIYVGYGSSEELKSANIQGKMVLALAGSRDADNVNKMFTSSRDKLVEVKKLGGIGLVEVLAIPQIPWPALVNYFLGGSKWGLKSETSIPHLWLKFPDWSSFKPKEKEIISGAIDVNGTDLAFIAGRNIAGLIEGTDPKLKQEYVVMTAHYDHIGVQNSNEEDSIFNGARDNAIGTVALLQAAKFLSLNPPKRSVILVAVTSEEKGLLGSQWYADHPLVPLNQHVLNVNCDGVGYNDKSKITSISLGRTNVDEHVKTAAKEFGLTVGGDPDPKENFFERSDQVSFAKKGIPAIKLQPGLREMDDEIRKYYHRQADEVSSLDFDYLLKFYQAYVYTVALITNDGKRPAWVRGDKFEAIAKQLYGK